MKRVFLVLILLVAAAVCNGRVTTSDISIGTVSPEDSLVSLLRSKFSQVNTDVDAVGGFSNKGTGDWYYVDSAVGSDTYTGTKWEWALATIDAAIGKCTENNGDVIFVAHGHTDTVTSSGGIAVDIAGITIIGLGSGDNRPKITFTTSANAAVNITADDCTLSNLLFVNGVNNQSRMILVTADDTKIICCEFRDGAATNGKTAIEIGSDDNDSDRCLVSGCKFYQVGGNGYSSVTINSDNIGIKLADNEIYGDFDYGGIYVPANGNACLNLGIRDNIITNIKASGTGISINGTSATVVLRDNEVFCDTPANAYSFDASIIQVAGIGLPSGLGDGTGVYPASVVDDSLWAKVLSKASTPSASSYNNTTDSLEAIGVDVDTIIAEMSEADANVAIIVSELAEADANLALVLADTGELQTDWVNGGRLDLLLDGANTDTDTLIAELAEADANLALALADTGELQTDWVNGGRLDLLLDGANTDTDTLIAELAEADANLALVLADTGELQTDWVNGGRLDLLLDGANTDTDTLIAELAEADANLALVLADTGELQTDWVNGGRLDLLIDSLIAELAEADANLALTLADTGELQTDWVNGGRLDLLLDGANTDTDTLIAELAEADANLALVLADTGELQTDWVNGGRLDLLLDGANTDTDTLIAELAEADANLALVLADTGELQTDWVNGGRLDLLIDSLIAELAESDANLALALADTGELQTDWVNGGRLDLLIDSIIFELAEADANVALVLADTGELQTDWVNGGRLDLLIDSIIFELAETDANAALILADTAAMQPVIDAVERSIEQAVCVPASGDVAIFNITGGPILVTDFVGIVSSNISATAATCQIQLDVTTPANTINLSTAVAIDTDAAGTSYTFTAASPSILTPTTNGGLDQLPLNRWFCPIGGIVANFTDTNTGNIKWYMSYKPLSPNSVVTAP